MRADELEALRLTDYEGLYQEQCAARMGVSRTTLSRTVAEARRKIADALLHGKRLVIARADAASLNVDRIGSLPESEPRIEEEREEPQAVSGSEQRGLQIPANDAEDTES
jgi:transcriptional regulator with XRE-family HTH domain